MDLSDQTSDHRAFGCPVCGSCQHEQHQSPLPDRSSDSVSDSVSAPVPVYRCLNCRVYFLEPGTADREAAMRRSTAPG